MPDIITENPLPALDTVTGRIFAGPLIGVMTSPINSPSDFLNQFWQAYPQGTPVVNGKVFESLVTVLLTRMNLKPLFVQANIAFVPNVIFDLVLFSEEHGPIVLSIKTSLRERYKQADLEGMVLRNVHRKARTYLITANEQEAENVNQKIREGDVLGIQEVVYAFGKSMDDLILFLRQLTLSMPGTKEIMTAPKIIK
jgi:hypothetical protein